MVNAEHALLERITVDPEVCFGKPCIRGMRYPVAYLLEYLAGGDSIDDIVAEFPGLERDDLRACLVYASKLAGGRSIGELRSRAA